MGNSLEVKLAKIRGAREVRERREQSRLVNADFVKRMEAELKANACKGDWKQWKPDVSQAKSELKHHILKLEDALEKGESQMVSEYAADVANIAMKIAETHGS